MKRLIRRDETWLRTLVELSKTEPAPVIETLRILRSSKPATFKERDVLATWSRSAIGATQADQRRTFEVIGELVNGGVIYELDLGRGFSFKPPRAQRFTDAELATYSKLVVPRAPIGIVFNVKTQFDWVRAKHADTGKDRRFRRFHCDIHLAGERTYAPVHTVHPLVETQYIVFDLDNKTGDRADLVHRLRRLQDALGPIPIVLFRSSSSNGLHVYVYFEEFVTTTVARLFATKLLEKYGITLKDGRFELWPANKGLRLPLGRGSCILDPDTLEPLAIKGINRDGALRRDVSGSIALLARMVEKARIPFKDFENRANGVCPADPHPARNCGAPQGAAPAASSFGVAQDRMRVVTSLGSGVASNGPGPLKGAAYHADLAASAGGVSERGLRRDQANRRLFDLYIAKGMTRGPTLATFEAWLREGDHASRSIQGHRERTIRKMMKDAKGYLDHLDKGLEAGRLHKQCSTTPRPPLDAALTCILPLVQHRAREAGYSGQGAWKQFAATFLKSADHSFLASEPDLQMPGKIRGDLTREVVPAEATG